VADREDFSGVTEQYLLVRDKALQANRVHVDTGSGL
jgi:hypothetical protein